MARRRLSLKQRRRASILVGLLWCMAFLSIVVIGVLHTARMDLTVVKNYGDTIQAHYLALAGVEKAKALLYQDASSRRHTAKNHTGDLYDAPREFKEVPFSRGQFSVFRQGGQEDGGRIIYGISDEESCLNVNQASTEELMKLEGMTADVAAAIVDYRDEDNTVTPGGAEAEYYMSLQPPYLPRNGPLQTIRELLMVRGVSRELCFGEDANANGVLDADEDDGNESDPLDNHDGILDAGWSSLLTVNSSASSSSAAGKDRVDVQSADETSLTGVQGITSDIAKAIVAYRNQNRIETLADLLEVGAVTQSQPAPGQPPGSAAPQANGPKVISESLLMDIGDDVTAGQSQSGTVNINTASVAVLQCLQGITRDLAYAIVSYRQSSGFFPNTAYLLKVPGLTKQIFKQVAPKVTARSETFRILSEGKVNSTGARQRIQMIVRVGSTDVETLSYREDL